MNRVKEKGLIRIRPVAERLGISVPHTYRLAKSGEIPYVHIGKRSIRFGAEDIEENIRIHRHKAG